MECLTNSLVNVVAYRLGGLREQLLDFSGFLLVDHLRKHALLNPSLDVTSVADGGTLVVIGSIFDRLRSNQRVSRYTLRLLRVNRGIGIRGSPKRDHAHVRFKPRRFGFSSFQQPHSVFLLRSELGSLGFLLDGFIDGRGTWRLDSRGPLSQAAARQEHQGQYVASHNRSPKNAFSQGGRVHDETTRSVIISVRLAPFRYTLLPPQFVRVGDPMKKLCRVIL